jgi:hypothetical protein
MLLCVVLAVFFIVIFCNRFVLAAAPVLMLPKEIRIVSAL